MGDSGLRVWPIDGDSYGEVIEYPRFARYRMEPDAPGATGDAHHDLVVYEKDEAAEDGERELGRHRMTDVIVAYAGQPTPAAVSTVTEDPTPAKSGSSKSSTKAGTPVDKK